MAARDERKRGDAPDISHHGPFACFWSGAGKRCSTSTIGQHLTQPKPHQVGSRHARLTGEPMQLAMVFFRQHQLKSDILGSRSYAEHRPRQRTRNAVYSAMVQLRIGGQHGHEMDCQAQGRF